MTRQEHDRQNAKNPKKPTAAEWRQQEEARKFWEELRETYMKAGLSPYHFEEAMRFSGHLFEKPEEPKVKSAAELRAEQREQFESFRRRFSEAVRETKG
jgi:hypothetical protein